MKDMNRVFCRVTFSVALFVFLLNTAACSLFHGKKDEPASVRYLTFPEDLRQDGERIDKENYLPVPAAARLKDGTDRVSLAPPESAVEKKEVSASTLK